MKHFSALTSLRFIAAFLVFIHHYMCFNGFTHFGISDFWHMGENWLAVLLYEMRYGVTLFFVLSGFLLMVRYHESIFVKTSFGVYWIKRFARIMPLYWVLLSVFFYVYREPHWQAAHYGIFYTLTQAFFFDIKWSALGVAWSLTVEECFYLLLPLIILAMRYGCWVPERYLPAYKSRWIPVAVGALVLFVFAEVLWFAGEYLVRERITDFAGFMSNKNDLRTYTIFGRFSDFAIGMMFGLTYVKTRNKVLKKGWLADIAILVSTIGILVVCNQIYYEGGKYPAWNNLEAAGGSKLNFYNAIFSGIIIYFLCSSRSYITWALSWRPLQYLGEISFAMYLLHYNPLSFKLYDFARVQEWGFFTSILVIYTILTVLSALCYELIERPAQHLILEKAGCLPGSVRRPTALRLLGFARRSKDRAPKSDPPGGGSGGGGGMGPLALAC